MLHRTNPERYVQIPHLVHRTSIAAPICSSVATSETTACQATQEHQTQLAILHLLVVAHQFKITRCPKPRRHDRQPARTNSLDSSHHIDINPPQTA
jgi:hypothetical protein